MNFEITEDPGFSPGMMYLDPLTIQLFENKEDVINILNILEKQWNIDEVDGEEWEYHKPDIIKFKPFKRIIHGTFEFAND